MSSAFKTLRGSPSVSRRWLGVSLAAAALGTAAVMAGCATGTPKAPGVFAPMPEGTITTFHRKSSGSYGVADGDIAWTHTRKDYNGRPVTAAVSTLGVINYYEPDLHQILATTDASGRLALSFDPPLGYRWPLEVGKTWTDKHQVTNHARKVTVPFEITYRVEAYEPVTVPAGTYQAFRVWSKDSMGETSTIWTAPSMGQPTVKRILDRDASAPQGVGHLEGELTLVKKP